MMIPPLHLTVALADLAETLPKPCNAGLIGRAVPRKPRLVGGVKGHNMNENFLSGKLRPVAGELHIEWVMEDFTESEVQQCWRSMVP